MFDSSLSVPAGPDIRSAGLRPTPRDGTGCTPMGTALSCAEGSSRYDSGRKALQFFAESHRLKTFPVLPFWLLSFCGRERPQGPARMFRPLACFNPRRPPIILRIAATDPVPSAPPSAAALQLRSRRPRSARRWPLGRRLSSMLLLLPRPRRGSILEAGSDSLAAGPFVSGVLVHALPTASRAQPPAAVDNRRQPIHRKDPASRHLPGEPSSRFPMDQASRSRARRRGRSRFSGTRRCTRRGEAGDAPEIACWGVSGAAPEPALQAICQNGSSRSSIDTTPTTMTGSKRCF
jgi:hypothetical protein